MKYGVYILLVFLFSIGCANPQNSKMNGVSFVAAPDKATQEHVAPVLDLQANYAAIMPFGFMRELSSTEIIFDTERQWFGETSEGAKQYIDLLKNNEIKVMLKPQIWVWKGEFTGFIKMQSEADWKQFEGSYKKFIMTYASLAEELQLPIFCIGTELEQFVLARPNYWKGLIAEIRSVYKGKLTYAANWDEYKRIYLWEYLDFIGVDAYFPISDSQTPTVEEALLGWEPWLKELQGISATYDRKILFTEYGYRSVDYAGREPWDSNWELKGVNLKAQENLLDGMYQAVWEQPWFAGGFIWKWFIAHDRVGGVNDNQFTPQNKPAQQIVKQAYSVNK